MDKKFIHIYSCFPHADERTNTAALADKILKDLVDTGAIEYAGYLENEALRSDLIERMGLFDMNRYGKISELALGALNSEILGAFETCAEALPVPELSANVFVFPWFPEKSQEAEFGGVNAVAVHENVMHIYVSPAGYDASTVRETVAHEYTHLAFYTFRDGQDRTLLDNLFMEGVAEVFREEVIGGNHAPWSLAYGHDDAIWALEDIREFLDSPDHEIRDRILYGGADHKKWGGYSIGYWLVSDFRKRHPEMSWREIIEMNASSIIPDSRK